MKRKTVIEENKYNLYYRQAEQIACDSCNQPSDNDDDNSNMESQNIVKLE